MHFFCERHKPAHVEYFCCQHNQLLCVKCYREHSGHAEHICRINCESLTEQATKLIELIEERDQRLHVAKDDLQRIIDKNELSSEKVIKTFQNAIEVLHE